MSVAVCRASLLMPNFPETNYWMPEMVKPAAPAVETEEVVLEEKQRNTFSAAPYVHPLVLRSSILMSQKSLEICTESLGSETGSDEFISGDELDSLYFETDDEEEKTAEEEEETDHHLEIERKDLPNVNYHCSIGGRSTLRSFPPPLPSITRRGGPCFKMQPHRFNGRLIVEAVPVPSVNYLHAERHAGRLLLSFINTDPVLTSFEQSELDDKEEKEEELKETEQEEQIMEVVDRGTIVEVKVSMQTKVKVHRSSLVINKFVVGSPLPPETAQNAGKKTTMATTTAAAAAVAASSVSALTSTSEGFQYNYMLDNHVSRWGLQSLAAAAAAEAKVVFSSKRRSREELLHDMRRCSELRRPLFIFEKPYCIATS